MSDEGSHTPTDGGEKREEVCVFEGRRRVSECQ
jgi:hypothetical protein